MTNLNQRIIDIDTILSFKNETHWNRILNSCMDINDYYINQLLPKVTYDDWVVCYYLEDNKLYIVTEDSVMEVECVEVFEYNDEYCPIDKEGNELDTDDLVFCVDDYDYCGESDDMTCYAYFRIVDNY